MSETLEDIQERLDILAKPNSNEVVSRKEFQDLIWIVKNLTEEQLRLSKELKWKTTSSNRKG